jgi:ubiquinone/menaquinone biosynthesis C-methylase UbiE
MMNENARPITSRYIHSTSAEEQRRLSLLNDIINCETLRELCLRGGERILDIGSGLAQFSRAMARAVGPSGSVLGVERDADQLAGAIQQAGDAGEADLVELRQGDALALPLRAEEWGSFDIVHARFLLEHVPAPLFVVREMVRAVRPGGRIVLADDDHDVLRLWPEPPGFWQIWSAYIRTYDRLGNDPYVGRRLISLLHDAGARPTRNSAIFMGGCGGSPTFEAVMANLIGILAGARDTILAQALLDRDVYDSGLNTLGTWSERPDAACWYTICWAEGIRPLTEP